MITDIVYEILAGYNELTAGAIHKKCAGKAGISNKKEVSNALTRLKEKGLVESVYDDDKGMWMWNVIRSETDARQSPDAGDHSDHNLEMASDAAELEVTHKESLTVAETEKPHSLTGLEGTVYHQKMTEWLDSQKPAEPEVRAKPRKPYTPNKIAGAYTYRGALVIKLDRKAHAKSITLSAKDMAMLASIYGNMS